MMNIRNLRDKINKICFVIMRNGFHYEGKITEISGTTLFMDDKFNQKVELTISDISSIVIKNGWGYLETMDEFI